MVQNCIIDDATKNHDPLAANARALLVAQLAPIADAPDSALIMKVDQNGKAGNRADYNEISQRAPGADALIMPEDADIRKDNDETVFP